MRKHEKETELFAAYLLISGDKLNELLEQGLVKEAPDPISELAEEFQVSENFIRKRLEFRRRLNEKMEITDDEAVFRDAVKSIIDIIKRSGKTRSSIYLAPKINLTERFWYLNLESKIIYPSLYELDEELKKLEPVRRCLSLMLKRNFPECLEMKIVDKDGKPVENPDYAPFLMDEILGFLVNKYLELYGFEFNEERFKKLYDEMVEYVYSPQRELVLVSPLENFELKGKDEFLVDEYKIRKLTDWELRTLINFGYRVGVMFTPEHGSIETIYCIERVIRTPKRSTPPLEPFVQDFITALRLFKPGAVGFNVVLRYPKVWRTSWSASFSHEVKLRKHSKYILEEEDEQPFVEFWKKFKEAKDRFSNSVKFSLRWYNKAYEEKEDLDRLLDLAVALEVLFGTSDRLDLYVPFFICSYREEKQKVNEDIKKLRKIRGAIVHSGYYKVTHDFVNRIEDIYRTSMQKFLKLLPSSSYESVIKGIRESLLD